MNTLLSKTLITITAIAAITLLVNTALSKGIDGAVLMAGLSILGGLAGYSLKKPTHKPPPPAGS